MKQQSVSRWTLVVAGSVLIFFFSADFAVYGRFTWTVIVAGTISSVPLAIRALRPPHDFLQGLLCFLGGLFLGGTAVAVAAPDHFFIPRAFLAAVLLFYGFRNATEEDPDQPHRWDATSVFHLTVARLLSDGRGKSTRRR